MRVLPLDKDTNCHYACGVVKFELQDYAGAIEEYNKAIEINSKHPWAYNDRGEAKRKLNDLTGAIDDFTTSIQNNPTHGAGYICRGYARYKLGDKEGACSDWNTVGEMGEKHAFYLIKLFYE